MSMVQTDMLTAQDLSDADRAILDLLGEGRATKGYLVDETGYHRNTIRHRLDVLEAGGVVRCVHDPTVLYELVEDPRERDRDDQDQEGDQGEGDE